MRGTSSVCVDVAARSTRVSAMWHARRTACIAWAMRCHAETLYHGRRMGEYVEWRGGEWGVGEWSGAEGGWEAGEAGAGQSRRRCARAAGPGWAKGGGCARGMDSGLGIAVVTLGGYWA